MERPEAERGSARSGVGFRWRTMSPASRPKAEARPPSRSHSASAPPPFIVARRSFATRGDRGPPARSGRSRLQNGAVRPRHMCRHVARRDLRAVSSTRRHIPERARRVPDEVVEHLPDDTSGRDVRKELRTCRSASPEGGRGSRISRRPNGQAAWKSRTKVSTTVRRSAACSERPSDRLISWVEAVPVTSAACPTPAMFSVTCCVPVAAC